MSTRSVCDVKHSTCHKHRCPQINNDVPNKSVAKIKNYELYIVLYNDDITWNILQEDLRLKKYKNQLAQEYKPSEHSMRKIELTVFQSDLNLVHCFIKKPSW